MKASEGGLDDGREHGPLSGQTLVLATIAVALSNFMVILDTTIANVSIPTIAGSLAVSPSQGTWVITSYSVAEAIVVPLTGWLVMRFGTVKLFVWSLLAFIAMSVACGLARSLESLVLFRVLQGIVGGPLLPLSQALLFMSYPREKMGVGQGIWGMTTIAGPAAGPLLGGYISDNHSWPWIFFINVPFGLFSAWAVWKIFQSRETSVQKKPVDAVGLGLLVMAVGSFQLMLDKGKELDWFGSPFIVGLAVAAVVGFAFLLVWEWGEENPVVDLRLFLDRNFTVGALSLALIFGIFFGSVVLIPLWLQTQMGYTAFWAGLATFPNAIVAMMLAPLVGKHQHRFDGRVLVSISLTVFMSAFYLRTIFTSQVDYGHLIVPQMMQGVAMVLFLLPLSQISLSNIPAHKVASAAGLQSFLRTTFAAFAASIATTFWEDQSSRHHAQLADSINPSNPNVQATLQQAEALGLDGNQALAFLDRTVTGQAVMLATIDYFAYCIPILLAIMVFVWFAKPKRGAVVDAGGH